MKSVTDYKQGMSFARPHHISLFKIIFLVVLILTNISLSLQAQEVKFKKPSWWLGVTGGLNSNSYTGTTQELNSNLTVPTAFQKGGGKGLFAVPVLEFHRADSKWGFMLQLGYDSRAGSFDQVFTPGNAYQDLSTKLAYVSLEPSLRYNLFHSNLFLFAGPRLAYSSDYRYTYMQGSNGEQPVDQNIEWYFDNMKKFLISGQVGAGYDISISPKENKTQLQLSPFVSYHPAFGQKPRTVEKWNVTTLRFGVALKFGRYQKIPPIEPIVLPVVIAAEPKEKITKEEIQKKSEVINPIEALPMNNYVYFDSKSTENNDIQQKTNSTDFHSEILNQQIIASDNILSKLGEAMLKNRLSTISLIVDPSEKDKISGKNLAESVQIYLSSVFGINSNRIAIKILKNPRSLKELSLGVHKIALLNDKTNQISIESNSPDLQTELSKDPEYAQKVEKAFTVCEAPIESYVSFNIAGGTNEEFSSWSMQIKDVQGNFLNFGPYQNERTDIPVKSILGNNSYGNYEITFTIQLKTNKTITKKTTAHFISWTPPVPDKSMRFSIIYEFNNAKSIRIFERYLTDIVSPNIPNKATVVIHGHSNLLESDNYEMRLFLTRANDTKKIIENALTKAGKTAVQLDVHGYGEDQYVAPFEEVNPENRFYIRTVIIDIIPK